MQPPRQVATCSQPQSENTPVNIVCVASIPTHHVQAVHMSAPAANDTALLGRKHRFETDVDIRDRCTPSPIELPLAYGRRDIRCAVSGRNSMVSLVHAPGSLSDTHMPIAATPALLLDASGESSADVATLHGTTTLPDVIHILTRGSTSPTCPASSEVRYTRTRPQVSQHVRKGDRSMPLHTQLTSMLRVAVQCVHMAVASCILAYQVVLNMR